MAENKIRVSITLPKNVLGRIDSDRGLTKRSTFLASFVEEAYKKGVKI